MGQGIGEVLTFAVGVAISPVPIIAVILMLFSARAMVNGPMFLLGRVVALRRELHRLLRVGLRQLRGGGRGALSAILDPLPVPSAFERG